MIAAPATGQAVDVCLHPSIAVCRYMPMAVCADCRPLLYKCLDCGTVGRYDEMKARG